MKISRCPKCEYPMRCLAVLGRATVDWVCVNPACGMATKPCPNCKSEVEPRATGLGPAKYICDCGHVMA